MTTNRSNKLTVLALAAFALVPAGCGEVGVKTAARPTASPRNGSIAYERELPAGTQIFTAEADGTAERQLTRVDGNATRPDWSPDGKRIAFAIEHTHAKPHPYCSVALINPDGSGLTDLASGRGGCDGAPSFTPDGRRIVFRTYDEVKDREGIASMDLSGGDRRRIPTPWRAGVDSPLTSPDGRWVTLLRLTKDDARNALYAMRPDGSQLHRLTPGRWSVAGKYDWSPDGKLIVLTVHGHFVRPKESANVVTIHPDGTLATRITRFKGARNNAFTGSFAPDGKKIMLRLERGESYHLATVDRDGRNLHALGSFSSRRPRAIDWGTQ